jgi:hypothetical protein
MACTLKQVEAIPGSYPATPSGLSAAAAALDAAMIWQRIESYICHRFTARAVVWTVEGPGEWEPPLTPATLGLVEVWANDGWETVAPSPSPLGGIFLPLGGPYRIAANAGGGNVPAAVSGAYRRLAEYSAEIGDNSMVAGHPSHTSHSVQIGGAINENFDRPVTWAAKAMINSGAGDLLRPYRRAG